MLGQIERGQSSPTINVLWKISTGLKIPLSFFCKQQEVEYTVASLDEENVITEVLRHFLDAYGQHMEFCQIQLNYMDWHFQNAQEKVAILQKVGIPVWVMEPLRGGKLVKASGELAETLHSMCPKETVTGWAFHFQQSVPSVMINVVNLMKNHFDN